LFERTSENVLKCVGDSNLARVNRLLAGRFIWKEWQNAEHTSRKSMSWRRELPVVSDQTGNVSRGISRDRAFSCLSIVMEGARA